MDKPRRMIRAVLVDDEPLARRGILSLLRSEPDVQVVAECGDGQEALHEIEALRPDVVFLDVQMPVLDGFETLRHIPRDRRPMIVFVTAYQEFALRAFDEHAIDYLLKPVDPDRLRESVERVRRAVGRDDAARGERMDALLEHLAAAAAPEPRHFAVRVGDRRIVVPHDEVDRLEAEGNYVRLHAAGQSYLLREALSRAAARLDRRRFLQVHRGTLVNTARIREVQSVPRGEYVVVLRDGTRVPTGPAFRDGLEAWLGSAA